MTPVLLADSLWTKPSCHRDSLFIMPQFSIFDPRERPFDRPACPNCGCPMWLAIVEPDKPGHEKRSYECPRCQREDEHVVQSGSGDTD